MLLDTSGLFCAFDKADRNHREALRLLGSASRRVTHNDVIAEFIALANARRAPSFSFLQFVDQLQNDPTIQLIHVDENQHHQALYLLRNRLDKRWSLCDAVSFLMMRAVQVNEALTTDHHFEEAGFVRLLKN